MAEVPVVNGHNCFEVALPELPHGYRFDIKQPLRLVPFSTFEGHLPVIDICRTCYIYAISHFDVVQVNAISARATARDPAPIALAGLAQFAGIVDAIGHPMFEDMNPVVPREGRTLVLIDRHYALSGTPSQMPSLTYLIKYSNVDDPHLHRFTTAAEFELVNYHGAGNVIKEYWYGFKPHRINAPFIRSILNALTPFANTAIWNKLPYEEAQALNELWRTQKLEIWTSGLTVTALRAREGLA
ncbi:hypothetical protein QFC20_006351 [Naganishia adeliensis]|uniref:Uncharacterized protein n=1 Tax=Naganishia adeliensis TaxID=92952 RepID=A0ACC2VC18_9TREE|nr:hypothetical protein QFC20_006351 [Naganishia adeliensis]